MNINDDVTLITFLGTKEPQEEQNPSENYWTLIGQKGQIIELDGQHSLVLFNIDIDSFHLENHNPIKNSLWISLQDLKIN